MVRQFKNTYIYIYIYEMHSPHIAVTSFLVAVTRRSSSSSFLSPRSKHGFSDTLDDCFADDKHEGKNGSSNQLLFAEPSGCVPPAPALLSCNSVIAVMAPSS
jgi:hypothetical protein